MSSGVGSTEPPGEGRSAGTGARAYGELAQLGVATVYEASGRVGLVDVPLTQLIAGSRAAGPARTVRCGAGPTT